MELSDQFNQAVAESKSLSKKPDNETLLQLYSLFKQGSIGDVNIDAPSNSFDFVNKAKYDSWAALKGKANEEAMKEYVALINKLKNN